MNDSDLLKEAIHLIANWCVDIEENGTSWDDWDENYKNAAYENRKNPLYLLIKEEMKKIKEEKK